MKFHEKINFILTMNIKDKFYYFFDYIIKDLFMTQLQYKQNFSGKFEFIDRSKNQKNLVLIVAGYKDFLWDAVFERIIVFLPKNYDVCICVPGRDSNKLREIAKKNSWSYLFTRENKLALAQNLAIRKHPYSKYIFKLDEDIFIGKNYFERLLATYKEVEKEGIYSPGFVAPILNINGVSYIDFLKFIKKDKEFKNKFGEFVSRCGHSKINEDPLVSEYIWKNTFPIDEVAEKVFLKNKGKYRIIPHQYSIGAILFKKDFFDKMGGFKVGVEKILATEEVALTEYCVRESNPMILSMQTFGGHFAYGFQTNHMKKFFEENISLFRLSKKN